MTPIPYCGTPPAPGELLTRFNLDPVLLVALAVVIAAHYRLAPRSAADRSIALAGWSIATLAFISPLCALSVSLFSARVGQHMILVLIAAPLIAPALPPIAHSRHAVARLSAVATVFFVALWFWHMPLPYTATFSSDIVYWLMHISLFGSAIVLWRELLHHRSEQTTHVLAVGALTSIQMGLLGAVLTFAGHPLFWPHLLTSPLWGLTALRDQQLGGVFMWVPGIGLFLFAALRSLSRLWSALESESPT